MEPMTMLEYGRSVKMKEDDYGYKAWLGQLLFLRDDLPHIWCKTEQEHIACARSGGANLIGTHCSKSIFLPVAEIVHPSGKVVCVIRGNFHNWMVSVEASSDVTGKFERLFNTSHRTSSCYCEGFPPDRVYGSYEENRRRFTVCLYSMYNVTTFFFLLDQWAREE